MHSFEVPLDKGNLMVQYDTVKMSAASTTCGSLLIGQMHDLRISIILYV